VNFVFRQLHQLGDLGARWFASKPLLQRVRGAGNFVDHFADVHREADRARLIGDGSLDALTDPPSGVGTKFESAVIVKLFDGTHKTNIAFLDQIKKGNASVHIFLCDAYDQSKVGLDEAISRLLPLPDRHAEALTLVGGDLLTLLSRFGHPAGLDRLREHDFFLRGEQRHRRGFAQVHFDKVFEVLIVGDWPITVMAIARPAIDFVDNDAVRGPEVGDREYAVGSYARRKT